MGAPRSSRSSNGHKSGSGGGGSGSGSGNRRRGGGDASAPPQVAKLPPPVDTQRPVIVDATWPAAALHPHHNSFFTVVCGNTHLYWAIHEKRDVLANIDAPVSSARQASYQPVVFWRTSLVSQDEIEGPEASCSTLDRYLPSQALTMIYGEGQISDDDDDAVHTGEAASQYLCTKRMPVIYVYVVATNPTHLNGLKYLFREIPCQCFVLQASDFGFEIPYESIGSDRLAVMAGAATQHAHPLLCVDAGTAMTYIETDPTGKLIGGGGITLGIQASLDSLHAQTGQLPRVSVQEWKILIEPGRPPLTVSAASSTKEAMVGAVLREKAMLIGSVVEEFMMKHKNPTAAGEPSKQTVVEDAADPAKTSDSSEPVIPTVCVTGGDGDLVARLLKRDHGSVIEPTVSWKKQVGSIAVEHSHEHVKYEKHLIHHGIQDAVVRQAAVAGSSAIEILRDDLLGQRIARSFPGRPDADGDTVYRGTVVSIQRASPPADAEAGGVSVDQDYFGVLYDDGDFEELDVFELYDAMVLYSEQSEKATTRDKKTPEAIQAKATQAREAADHLLRSSELVKSHLAKRKAKLERERALPSPALKVDHPPRSVEKRAAAPAAVVPQAKKSRASADKHVEESVAVPLTEKPKRGRGRPPHQEKQEKQRQPSPRGRPSAASYGQEVVGKRIAKYFGTELYFGTITTFIPAAKTDISKDLFSVRYDDDDQEDLNNKELSVAFKLYSENGGKDENPVDNAGDGQLLIHSDAEGDVEAFVAKSVAEESDEGKGGIVIDDAMDVVANDDEKEKSGLIEEDPPATQETVTVDVDD